VNLWGGSWKENKKGREAIEKRRDWHSYSRFKTCCAGQSNEGGETMMSAAAAAAGMHPVEGQPFETKSPSRLRNEKQ